MVAEHRTSRASSTSVSRRKNGFGDALRAWMLLFVDYIATKKIVAAALSSLVGGSSKVFEASYGQVWQAIRALVKRAVKSGEIRKDLNPIDLLRALIGVANVRTSPDWQLKRAETGGHSHLRCAAIEMTSTT
jgi:hypothetical protein